MLQLLQAFRKLLRKIYHREKNNQKSRWSVYKVWSVNYKG